MKLRLRFLKIRQTFRLFWLKIRGLFHLRIREYSKAAIEKTPRNLEIELFGFAKILLGLLVAISLFTVFPVIRSVFLVKMPQSGGVYREGVVGSFANLNPLFAPANDVDKDAVALIFSGLMKADRNAEIVPDLADKVVTDPDGKTTHVYLKANLRWHDGEPLTADDVVYTIETIKNPDTASPLRPVWRGVKVQKVSDLELKFQTPKLSSFDSYLTQPIVPAHLLKNIPPKNLSFYDEFNLQPVGSGPFAFQSFRNLVDGQELALLRSANYGNGRPYLDGVTLRSYASEQEAVNGLEKQEVLAVAGLSGQYLRRTDRLNNLRDIPLRIAEYTAIFINTKSPALEDLKVRTGVAAAIDRDKLIREEPKERYPAYGPFLPGSIGYDGSARGPQFDPERSRTLLHQAGFTAGSDGVLKDGSDKPLELRLVALSGEFTDALLTSITDDLSRVGIKVTLIRPSLAEYEASFIIPRNYDLILTTENLGYDSDPYFYWHSSQAKDPGLNLSQLSSLKADAALEAARRSSDKAFRAKQYREFSKLIAAEVPAVFLYGRYYYYFVSDKVYGTMLTDYSRIVEPKDRFNQISKWYLNTRWVRKSRASTVK